MSDKPTIGFIGLGYMGHGMAKNIRKGGYEMMVKGNRNRAPVESLVGMGAVEAASPKAMAEACDIIFVCLSNSPQVEAVIRGEDGILASGKRGLVVVDSTTSNPVSTMALAAELDAAGMTLVDAPSGRTPVEAEAGTLDAMVGADNATFEVVRPVIDCWAGTITHVGPVGSGHKMKLVMNFLSLGYGALYAEAFTMAAKVGLSPQAVRGIIGGSRMGCGFFDTYTKGMVDRDRDAHKFSIDNAAKDIGYVAAMAADAGMANPMSAAVRNAFAQAQAMGKGRDYVPFLADHVAEMHGLDLSAEVEKGKG
jgi:3-hydroxyisobutyrate dehydrogenase-like beta-hydroxyacid dehydrogenase